MFSTILVEIGPMFVRNGANAMYPSPVQPLFFKSLVWSENLNEENKVSLFVRFIEIESGKYETRIINKNT